MHQIFIVTSTGYYSALQASSPTDDLSLLENLSGIIEKLRPGRGRWYEIAIARVTSAGTPTDEDRKKIDLLSESLNGSTEVITRNSRYMW